MRGKTDNADEAYISKNYYVWAIAKQLSNKCVHFLTLSA